MSEQIQVLDKGFVRLDAALADDLRVVNSARVSFNTRHEIMEDGDDKLINYLMKHKHGTPFEHNSICFHVKAPIFVFREWHRHRIGVSINEWSARYAQMKSEFYIPEVTNIREQIGKPGKYTYVPAPQDKAAEFIDSLRTSCKIAFNTYEAAIENGIAKEQARLMLPVNTYSEMYWTCNARSLMAFLSLRNTDQAQWEIRMFAVAMESIFLKLMPITYKSFIDNGRIAP